MKQQFSLFSLIFLSTSSMAQTVPHIFSPNTPAKAAEVNENFDFLASKSMGINLVNGKRSLDVDCSSDAAALNKAYIDNVNYRDLAFAIKGACYGDISVIRNFDGDNNWTGEKVQVAGQKVSIFPQEGQSASLIPNDLTGRVTIWASMSGGLYLADLNVQLAANDIGAGFSRNAHGNIQNVTFQGQSSPSGYGIWIQEGAQAYVTNTTINNVAMGIMGYNGATIRFAGSNTIAASGTGLFLNGTKVRNGSAITSTAPTSLKLEHGSVWHGVKQEVINAAGSVFVQNGSSLMTQNLSAAGHDVTFVRSSSELKNIAANHLTLHHSNVEAESVTLTSNIDVNHNSSFITGSNGSSAVNVYINEQSTAYLNNFTPSGDIAASSTSNVHIAGSTVKNVRADFSSHMYINGTSVSGQVGLDGNSSANLLSVTGTAELYLQTGAYAYLQESTLKDVHVRRSSKAHIYNSTITTEFDVIENSYLLANDVTFNGQSLSVHNSQAFINGTTKLPLTKLTCNGLAMVQYEGADLLNEAADSNCLDNRAMDTLKTLLKANHPATPN